MLKLSNTIVNRISEVDPIVGRILSSTIPLELERPREGYFESLCRIIVGQQLSSLAAKAIWTRLKHQIKNITPENLMLSDTNQLRVLGLSYRKIGAIKDLSHAILKNELDLSAFENLDTNIIREKLTSIKGLGNWTVDMFLIFSMNNQDIFSASDASLRKAMNIIFETELSEQQIIEKSHNWTPYRTYVSLALWKAIDIGII